MLFVFFLTFFCAMFAAKPLFAWGEGHEVTALAAAQNLPAPWKERILNHPETLRQFLSDSHYPDSFEILEQERWGDDFLSQLKNFGIEKRYDFHSSFSRCTAFLLLVEALRREDEPRALLLLAILSHSIADQTACNHEPLVQYATYTLGAEGLGVTPALQLDLGWIQKNETAKKIWEKRCGKLTEISFENDAKNKTLQEVFERLHEMEWDGVRFSKNGALILENAFILAKEPENQEAQVRLATEFAELGAFSAEQTLRIFYAALEIAKNSDEPPFCNENLQDFTSVLSADFNARIDTFVQNRPVEEDGFCVPFLPKKEEKSTEVRILYDSTGRWNEGFFHGLDRIPAVQLAGTLRKNGFSVTLWDVRDFVRNGEKNFSDVRLLIVPNERCESYHGTDCSTFYKRIHTYLNTGGNVLWVGNRVPKEVHEAASRSISQIPEVDAYAKPAFPVPMSEILEAGAALKSGSVWKFRRIPQGSAGWYWPSGRAFISENHDEEIFPTVEFVFPDAHRLSVGFVTPHEHPTFGFVPLYVLNPYVFTDEKPTFSPLELSLDSVGTAILLDFMKRFDLSKE